MALGISQFETKWIQTKLHFRIFYTLGWDNKRVNPWQLLILKIGQWLIFIMTGTRFIRIFCQKWYAPFTFYVTGPQNPTFVLTSGTFCNFCPPPPPPPRAHMKCQFALILYMGNVYMSSPSKQTPIVPSLMGVWQGWEYENVQFGDVGHYSRISLFSGNIVSTM